MQQTKGMERDKSKNILHKVQRKMKRMIDLQEQKHQNDLENGRL